MARYTFAVEVPVPRETIFDLWTAIDRVPEWTHGATRLSEIKGTPGEPGTTYKVWYGSLDEKVEVLEATRPLVVRTRTRFGGIRAEAQAAFEATDGGTRIWLAWTVRGLKSRAWGRLMAIGSYRWTFRRELERFAEIAEREMSESAATPAPAMSADGLPAPKSRRRESMIAR